VTTFPIIDENGRVFAFEIENVYLSVKTIARLLSSVAGVSDVKGRRPFSSSRDVHAKFRYRGHAFLVWEPYGDNSRYWIGPDDDKRRPIVDLRPIEEVFGRHTVPAPIQLLGDLVSLNIFRRGRAG
jgi:hypothetical protein